VPDTCAADTCAADTCAADTCAADATAADTTKPDKSEPGKALTTTALAGRTLVDSIPAATRGPAPPRLGRRQTAAPLASPPTAHDTDVPPAAPTPPLFPMRRLAPLLLACLPLCLGSCSGPKTARILATGQLAADFDTYPLRRIGLLPVQAPGASGSDERTIELTQAAYAQFSRSTPYEIVLLSPADLGELELGQPLRSGSYQLTALAELARRNSLDGLLWIHVTGQRVFPPLGLDLTSELVALETGQVIWTAAVHLDANDPAVKKGLEAYYRQDSSAGEVWSVALLSPQRFANFGFWQIAQLL
jgi:hypothetical protein